MHCSLCCAVDSVRKALSIFFCKNQAEIEIKSFKCFYELKIYFCVSSRVDIFLDDNLINQVGRRFAFVNQMIASYKIDRISCSGVLFIQFFLQQVPFQVIDDVRFVGDVASKQRIVFDRLLNNSFINISVLLFINQLPFVCARIENL